ncbi:MAG TPA: PilZ domain-containing protein [Candidatus Angelobacter sp.]|nr:PilZ domain-containing protein [Candidatus Angelobacter sp.]
MEPERRHAKRTTPEELSYIRFEPEGGGIVLNASEEGLAFHAAAPVRQSGKIRFCVSPNPEHRIELVGEIAWLGDAKKSGGLRLIEVPDESRDQIRAWLTAVIGTRPQQIHLLPPGWKSVHPHATSSREQGKTPEQPPPAALSPVFTSLRTTAPAIPAPRTFGSSTSDIFSELRSPENHEAYSHRRWLGGAATGFVILIFALVPFLHLQSFRSNAGDVLIHLGEKLKGAVAVQADLSASTAGQARTPGSPVASTPAASDLKTDAAQVVALSNPPAAAQIEPEKALIREPNKDERAASAPSRQDVHTRASRSALANRLWSEVEAGDSKAEVELAQLYLKGDGVTRNCEQARVLLQAAAKKGNAEALQEYRKLNFAACH